MWRIEVKTRRSVEARVESLCGHRLRRWRADACRLPGDCEAKLQEWFRFAEEDAEWLESAREAGDSERARASFAEVGQWVESRMRLPVELKTRTSEEARVENLFAHRLRRWRADACRLPGDCQAMLHTWFQLEREDLRWRQVRLEEATRARISRLNVQFGQLSVWVTTHSRLPLGHHVALSEPAREETRMAKLVSRWRRNHRLAPPCFQSAYAGWVHLAEVDLAWHDALRRDQADRTRAPFEGDVDALVDFVTTQGRMPTIVERDTKSCRLARFAERCRSRMLADELDAASIKRIVDSVILGSWWHDVEFA